MVRGGERGIALLVVVWALALLSVMAAAFTSNSRTETQLGYNLVATAQARALAEAGVARAVYSLLEPDLARRWRADGIVYALDLDGGKVAVTVQDEAGKIDLNRAPEALLYALLLAVTGDASQSEALRRSIDDWRAPVGQGLLAAAAGPEGAAQRNFEAVEELRRVPGVTAELYDRLEPALTVYSHRATANPMTAPLQVLYALPGLRPADLHAILAARAEPVDPAQLMRRMQAIGAERFGSITIARVFTIRAEARSPDGALFVREAITGFARPPGPPFEFYAWRQGRQP